MTNKKCLTIDTSMEIEKPHTFSGFLHGPSRIAFPDITGKDQWKRFLIFFEE